MMRRISSRPSVSNKRPRRHLRLRALVPGVVLLAAFAAHLRSDGERLPEAREVSVETGIHEVTHTWGADVGDFDGDGWEDVLIAPHKRSSPPPRLYRNTGGRFERVPSTNLPLTRKDRHDCDWGDVNRDGREDLYCSVGGGKGTKRNPNDLWLQRPDGSFVDRARAYGVEDLNGRGRDVALFDANRDGFLDLFVANGYPRQDGRRVENKLFINVGGKRLREAPEYRLNRQVGGSRVQAADYDADGWTDLLLCGQEDRPYLYRNRGVAFEDVSEEARVGQTCRSALLANIDSTDFPGLVLITRSRFVVKRQTWDGRFLRVYERKLRNAGDAAAGNVDGDGRDDFYVMQRGPTGDDEDDLVLLNDGDGRSFREAPIPQTHEGKGDRVVAVDHDRNDRTDFIVLNGKNKAKGPIRLIAFR